MKPKTKLQKHIEDLAATLPPISQKQFAWGVQKCLDDIGHRRNYRTWCLECGYSWTPSNSPLSDTLIGDTCPSCGRKLKFQNGWGIESVNNSAYMGVIDAAGEYQVVRLIWVEKKYKKGEPAKLKTYEVAQTWIDPKGEKIHRGIQVNGYGFCYDRWIFGTQMEIRTAHHRYEEPPFKVYPTMKASPTMKRNGFNRNLHDIRPITFFVNLATQPVFETLLKTGQVKLLQYYTTSVDHKVAIEKLWPSVKICIRHGYNIKNATEWCDYIKMLERQKKDIRNPKYICPANLTEEHDRISAIILKRDNSDAQQAYQKAKGQFFGLVISDKKLNVKVLETVEEFRYEGKVMKHCIYSSAYYEKPDSLILSARDKDNNPIETVEVLLSSMKINQCYGPRNQRTKHHDHIIHLVNENLPRIAKIAKQQHATV